ncbi:MAG: MFS transporter [Bacteriovoracaceae bacterium]
MPNDFKKLMLARLLFTSAAQMQAVVLGWKMYELTNDPLALGMIGLAEAVPALSLALYAGNIVDKSRPLIVYRRVLMISFLSALVVLLSKFFSEQLTSQGHVISLYVASVLTGLARAFSQPAMFATVPRLVPRNLLTLSSAWMSSAVQIGRISGPALGGILYGFVGFKFTSMSICVLFLIAILEVSLISVINMPPHNSGKASGGKEDFLIGAKFVFKHPLLLPALSLDMFSVMFGSVVALLPIYCKEILLVGPKGLGLLRAAPSVGAILMSFYLTKFKFQKKAGFYLLSSVFGFGISILVFAVSKNFALSFVALLLSGSFDSVSMVIRSSIVQMFSPDHMRGRISAVNAMFIGSSNEIGEFESGVAAKFMGTVPSAIFGGLMCLICVITVTIMSPSLRSMNLEEAEKA